jgi:DHA1 family bicyclomycin/chloramphenicol resistance-like MFS transporter
MAVILRRDAPSHPVADARVRGRRQPLSQATQSNPRDSTAKRGFKDIMTSTSPTARTPWGLMIMLGALTGMAPLGIDMYLPSLPAIGADLGASDAQMQFTVAAFLAGMAVGQLVYGPASDRFGRRAPILIGVAIFTVATVACALAKTPELLILSRVVEALGGCAGIVVARAIVRDRFDHTQTASMLSLMMLIMGAAPILAPLLGGVLLGLGGWRLNFWAIAGYGLALWLAVVFRLKESRSTETAVLARAQHPLRSYVTLLRQRRLMGYLLAGALNGATLFTYIASSPGLLIGTYGIAPSKFGLVFGLNALGLMVSGQLNRMLLRRMTPDEILARFSLFAVAAAVALAVAAVSGLGGPWSVLPTLFVLLASYGCMQGNTMAGALNEDPHRAGSISALMGGASFAIGAAVSTIAGLFHDGTARPMALTMLAAVVGSAVALHGLALKRQV